MRYFLDCEFDGAFGPLISIALVPETYSGEDDAEVFYEVSDYVLDEEGNCRVENDWVGENVLPVLGPRTPLPEDLLRSYLGCYLESDPYPHFICDHPADIMYLSKLMILPQDPANTIYIAPRYTFEVCYTEEMKLTQILSKIPHNALADAVALRETYMAAHDEFARP